MNNKVSKKIRVVIIILLIINISLYLFLDWRAKSLISRTCFDFGTPEEAAVGMGRSVQLMYNAIFRGNMTFMIIFDIIATPIILKIYSIKERNENKIKG